MPGRRADVSVTIVPAGLFSWRRLEQHGALELSLLVCLSSLLNLLLLRSTAFSVLRGDAAELSCGPEPVIVPGELRSYPKTLRRCWSAVS